MLSAHRGWIVVAFAAATSGCVPHVLRADTAQGIAGRLRSPDAATRAEALSDARRELRFRCACTGGAKIGPGTQDVVDADLVPALVTQLDDPDPAVRGNAADVLTQMAGGPAGTPALSEHVLLKAIEHPECEGLLRLYPGTPSEAAIPVLERVLRRSREGADLLARTDEGRARLLALVFDESAAPAPRESALRALAPCSIDEADRVCALLLEPKTDRRLRDGAADLLGTPGTALPPDRVGRIVAAYDASTDGAERAMFLEALREQVSGRLDLLDRLVAALGDGWVEGECAALLARLDRRQAVLARLEPLFDGPQRGQATRAMTLVGPSERMADRFARACADEREALHVRVACLRALGALGPAARGAWSVVARRAERTGDRDEYAAARAALESIDPKRAARTR